MYKYVRTYIELIFKRIDKLDILEMSVYSDDGNIRIDIFLFGPYHRQHTYRLIELLLAGRPFETQQLVRGSKRAKWCYLA